MSNRSRPDLQHEVGMSQLGQPGVTGRWQPTRAGVLNSWKWADEEFCFADGWLAFVGRNGSGKSLTASQLVTVLLDGDTSQTALSVSGRAAGTLMSRHTDNRDKEDKTGVWWLEYGRTDPDGQRTEHLTTGLWMRSTGQALLRAFFLTPGRVGQQLTLQVDRNPVGIDGLAEQLATHHGELFTDSQRLRPKAGSYLTAIRSEAAYRDAVRNRLFSPLDEVQYDALLGVLRTLRSVRTAEKISARDMLDVLTGALPALDQGKLGEIASAMQRIAALEKELADTQEQARRLAATDRVYDLYRRAVALSVAAALRASNTEFDNLTRRERAAEADLAGAKAAGARAEQTLRDLAIDLARLEGELGAAETALRDHAGAELPLREQSARELDAAAGNAEQRAEEAEGEAAGTARRSREQALAVTGAQQGLAKITTELSRTAVTLHADSTLTGLVAGTDDLIDSAPLDPDVDEPEVTVDELAAAPLAWIEIRRRRVDGVNDARAAAKTADGVAAAAAEQHREAVEENEDRRSELDGYADARVRSERQLVTDLAVWQRSAAHFPDIPDALVEPDAVDARVDPAALTAWLHRQLSAIRTRLDVPGHRARRDAAMDTAERSRRTVTDRESDARRARAEMTRAQTDGDGQAARNRAADAADAATEREAVTEHARQRDGAQQDRHDHLVTQVTLTGAALDAVVTWAEQVHRWRTALTHLNGDGLDVSVVATVPIEQLRIELATAIDPEVVERGGLTTDNRAVLVADRCIAALAGYRDTELRSRVAAAAQQSFGRLDRSIVLAETALADVRAAMRGIAADLQEARRAPAPPPAPSWRTRADGHPLWSLVDFHRDVHDTVRHGIEGALLVSGILDAVVTDDGRARTGDTVLSEEPARGPSAADVLVVEPDSPVDAALVRRLLDGIAIDHDAVTTVRSGVLVAAAPAGYVSRHIGTSARERARAERIAELEEQLDVLDAQQAAAVAALEERRQERASAETESRACPDSETWWGARTDAQTAQQAAQGADRAATQRETQADGLLRTVRTDLAALRQNREAVLSGLLAALATAMALAQQAALAVEAAQKVAEDSAERARRAVQLLADAETAQVLAEAQGQAFPPGTALVDACADEDEATRKLTEAQARVVAAAERVRVAQGQVRKATAALDRAVDLGDGRPLPAEPQALRTFVRAVDNLSEQVRSWQRSADRTITARAQGRTAIHEHRLATQRADRQRQEATTSRARAEQEKAAVTTLQALYGAAYSELETARDQAATACASARAEQERVRQQGQAAAVAAAAAATTLNGITPQRAAAGEQREGRLALVMRLVEESLATVGEGIAVDESGRPANLTAALAWSTRMLSESNTPGRDELPRLLEGRRTRLEAAAKTVSLELTRFDRQVTLQTIPGTDWRRAVVAAPEAVDGEDLHLTVMTLRQTAAQLDSDLRDDVKVTLKTSMFTALRRDIAVRRDAAQDLVRQIRATLGSVRTGVARVGVEVDWKVRNDTDAQRMIELVSGLPSDELFEQMYDVLRHRLENATGDTWHERVAHTFDYRAWHEWDIRVTHASFGDGPTEQFRPLTARSNPLAPFSTGEMRLATMLPLLAAAWSMYQAPTYHGPRLLFVDEVNAAFDPQNVRTLLGLLRGWQFDVLSTAPEMSALLKAEAEQVVIAHLTHSGVARIAIPWLWSGAGRPVLVDTQIPSAARARTAGS